MQSERAYSSQVHPGQATTMLIPGCETEAE
jgi:hypothetical protein